MLYHSTSSRYNTATLKEALLHTAVDSGALMPDRLPVIPKAIIASLPAMQLSDLAYCVAASLFGEDVDLEILRQIAMKTYSNQIPLVKLDKQVFALELWHGPTGTVKDYSVGFMAGLVDHIAVRQKEKVKILATATSNVAKAIVHSYASRPGVEVVLLVPRIGAHNTDMRYMENVTSNIHFIDIRGTEHQCRQLMAEALADKDLHHSGYVTAASTLNIGALLPQTIHFFYAYSRAVAQGASPDSIVFAIPCGNMAGLTAAVMAKRMGLPIKRIIATGNSNFWLKEYLETGEYPTHPTVNTMAHALDIAHPLNLARLKELYDNSHKAMVQDIVARSYDDGQINNAIITARCAMSYEIDPHSATAMLGVSECLEEGETGIILSTARPEPSTRHHNIKATNTIAPVYQQFKQALSNT